MPVAEFCVICEKPITNEWKKVLKADEKICQSWCMLCMTKWATAHPMTADKRDVITRFRAKKIYIHPQFM